MKQKYTLFGMLALCIGLLNSIVFVQQTYASDPKTVAVLYFENNSIVDKDKLDPLKKGLADMMITEMSKIKGIKVVERQRIQSIIEELNLSETDMVDKSTTQEMGKLLGAKVMLFGGFSNLFNDKLRIDVRLVRTETGETLKAEEETGELDEFLTMLQSLVKKIASDLDVKLSSEDEDRLEASKDGNFNGYVTYAKALNLEDQGKKMEKMGKNTEARSSYENAKSMYQKAFDESDGYEPAKQKMDEMASLISKLK
ncbi:MAG: CsgG/HfaB family protein [Bacteroidota bacterium]|nr:CsgG/HfaB family protein [Bacteroidota bacterium]